MITITVILFLIQKSRKSEKTVVFFCFLSYHKSNPIPDIPSAFLHKFPFLIPLYVERSIQLYSKVHSVGIKGVEGVPILGEADVSDGLPGFSMVGYLSSQVK